MEHCLLSRKRVSGVQIAIIQRYSGEVNPDGKPGAQLNNVKNNKKTANKSEGLLYVSTYVNSIILTCY